MGTNQPVISYINITTIKYFKRQYLHFHHRKFQSVRRCVTRLEIPVFFFHHLIAFEFKCLLSSVEYDVSFHFQRLELFSIDTKRYLLIKVLQMKTVNSNGKKNALRWHNNNRKKRAQFKYLAVLELGLPLLSLSLALFPSFAFDGNDHRVMSSSCSQHSNVLFDRANQSVLEVTVEWRCNIQ